MRPNTSCKCADRETALRATLLSMCCFTTDAHCASTSFLRSVLKAGCEYRHPARSAPPTATPGKSGVSASSDRGSVETCSHELALRDHRRVGGGEVKFTSGVRVSIRVQRLPADAIDRSAVGPGEEHAASVERVANRAIDCAVSFSTRLERRAMSVHSL